jgi:hypothetical protein
LCCKVENGKNAKRRKADASKKGKPAEEKILPAKGGKFAKTKDKKDRKVRDDAPPIQPTMEEPAVKEAVVEVEVVSEQPVMKEEPVTVVEGGCLKLLVTQREVAGEMQPEVAEDHDGHSDEDESYDPNDPNAAPWVEVANFPFPPFFPFDPFVARLIMLINLSPPICGISTKLYCPRREQLYYYNYMSGDMDWEFPEGENVFTWSTYK